MTGNVSALSDNLALGTWLTGGFFLVIVLAFILGAAISTILINAGRQRRMPGIYASCILVEAILLAALGALDTAFPGALHGAVLILGLSLLMGLQNAVVTRISDARVRTTHVSGMVTDIGIELGMLVGIARRTVAPDEAAATLSRLRLHGQTVLAFLAGGVVGVLVYGAIGGTELLLAAAVLAAIAANGLWRARAMTAAVSA